MSVRAFWHSGGTFANGRLTLEPGESAVIRFAAAPSSIGMHSMSVQLGGASLFLTADVQVTPPCSITFDGQLLVPLDGGVTDAGLHNSGAEVCLFSGMHLDPATVPFELQETVTGLDAGETFNIRVRALPNATADAGAQLRFTVNSPTASVVQLPVTVEP